MEAGKVGEDRGECRRKTGGIGGGQYALVKCQTLYNETQL